MPQPNPSTAVSWQTPKGTFRQIWPLLSTFLGGGGASSLYLPEEGERTEVGVERGVEGERVEADEEQGGGFSTGEPEHQQRNQGSLTHTGRSELKTIQQYATAEYVSRRWMAKLVALLLATAALLVRIQASLTNTKWATCGQHALARQKKVFQGLQTILSGQKISLVLAAVLDTDPGMPKCQTKKKKEEILCFRELDVL
jgi:hypothetical protein